MELRDIKAAVKARASVRITEEAGHAPGLVGILMGYRDWSDMVKVGLVDEAGEHTGEFATVARTSIELLPPAPAPAATATLTITGAFANYLDGTGAVQGAEDHLKSSRDLREAFLGGTVRRYGRRGHARTMTLGADALDLLVAYADAVVSMAGGGEWGRAEIRGAERACREGRAALKLLGC